MSSDIRVAHRLYAALVLGAIFTAGCASIGRKRLDFSNLTSADRIEVRTAEDKPIVAIHDPEKIVRAIRFIQERQDRWGDRISPFVPTFQLQFYNGNRYVGGYGVRANMLVAFPTHQGWYWRDVPADEIDGLLKAIGVEFERKQN